MTLHDRIEAAVRERMAVAQAATPGPWRADPTGEGDAAMTGPLIYGMHTEGYVHLPDAEFIAANDPARIVRDCAEDLDVLARHGGVVCEHGTKLARGLRAVRRRPGRVANARSTPPGTTDRTSTEPGASGATRSVSAPATRHQPRRWDDQVRVPDRDRRHVGRYGRCRLTDLLCLARCRPDQPRQAAPGYRLCWLCRDRLGRHLRELVDLVPNLEDAMTKGQALGEKVDTSHAPSLPLNIAAAAARYAIHADLVATVKLVLHERGLTAYPTDDIAAMATWLTRHVDWLAAHPSAGERADEAADWVSAAKSAINPNPPKVVKIGPCPVPDCTGVLSAVVRPQDHMLPSAITCSWWLDLEDKTDREPHSWSADQWHALARRMDRAGARKEKAA